jgi:hypothetical protein
VLRLCPACVLKLSGLVLDGLIVRRGTCRIRIAIIIQPRAGAPVAPNGPTFGVGPAGLVASAVAAGPDCRRETWEESPV